MFSSWRALMPMLPPGLSSKPVSRAWSTPRESTTKRGEFCSSGFGGGTAPPLGCGPGFSCICNQPWSSGRDCRGRTRPSSRPGGPTPGASGSAGPPPALHGQRGRSGSARVQAGEPKRSGEPCRALSGEPHAHPVEAQGDAVARCVHCPGSVRGRLGYYGPSDEAQRWAYRVSHGAPSRALRARRAEQRRRSASPWPCATARAPSAWADAR